MQIYRLSLYAIIGSTLLATLYGLYNSYLAPSPAQIAKAIKVKAEKEKVVQQQSNAASGSVGTENEWLPQEYAKGKGKKSKKN